jgi:RNA polymerase sigma-70 factor (ECF subfamily)
LRPCPESGARCLTPHLPAAGEGPLQPVRGQWCCGARALLGDEQLARDAQEVFLQVLKSEESFRAEASPVTWLYRITTNVALNMLKHRARRPEALGELPERHHDERVGVDERLSIYAVLARVPEPLREIATYYYLDQMSHDEIARLCNVSRRTVGNRLVEFHTAASLLAAPSKKAVS